MAITSVDQLVAAAEQRLTMCKTASRTTIAAMPFSLFELAGNPGAGTLAVGNTANGVVPTDAIAGAPVINAFGAGNTGYLSRVEFACSVACRLRLFDRLFSAGAFAYNAAVTLASQPDFSGRLPLVGGLPDYNGLEIWVETVTAATGNQTWNVIYTNQDGTTGKLTGAVGISAAPTLGRMWQLPLAAGDKGVQKIEVVTGGTGTAGTANIHIMRPLWSGRVAVPGGGDVHGFDRTGMPQLFDTSCLFLMAIADSTSSGVPEVYVDIANG